MTEQIPETPTATDAPPAAPTPTISATMAAHNVREKILEKFGLTKRGRGNLDVYLTMLQRYTVQMVHENPEILAAVVGITAAPISVDVSMLSSAPATTPTPE